jgi:hypothetical protein
MKGELELQSTKDLAPFLALGIYKAGTWKHISGVNVISCRDLECSNEGRHYFCGKQLTRAIFSCGSFSGTGLCASFDLPPELAKETADDPIPFSHDLQGLTHLVHFAFQSDQQNGSKSFEFFFVFVFLFLACLGTSHQAMMNQLLCLCGLVLEVKCKSMDL